MAKLAEQEQAYVELENTHAGESELTAQLQEELMTKKLNQQAVVNAWCFRQSDRQLVLRFFACWSTWVSSRAAFCLYARQLLAEATATPAARRRTANSNPYDVMPPTSVAALHTELVSCHKRLSSAKVAVERERRRAETAKRQVKEEKDKLAEVTAQLSHAHEQAKKYERNATHLQWKLAGTSMKATAVKAIIEARHGAQHSSAAFTPAAVRKVEERNRRHKGATVTHHHPQFERHMAEQQSLQHHPQDHASATNSTNTMVATTSNDLEEVDPTADQN
eukprot:SAG31_NODE_3824_length_3849_cov_2.006400_4_plen_278_part_00